MKLQTIIIIFILGVIFGQEEITPEEETFGQEEAAPEEATPEEAATEEAATEEAATEEAAPEETASEEAAFEEGTATMEGIGSLHDPSKCLENGEFDDDCCASMITDETIDPPVFEGTCADGYEIEWS